MVLILGVLFIDLPLTLGVIGHEGSTLIVVANGLRLLRTPENHKRAEPSVEVGKVMASEV